jgi:hypothetical protein
VNANPKEALMNSARRALAVLVAVLALALVPVAYAGVDYSKNAAGGDYAPAVTAPANTQPVSTDSGFAWGAAALGAGAALALVLVVTGVRSRRLIPRTRQEAA